MPRPPVIVLPHANMNTSSTAVDFDINSALQAISNLGTLYDKFITEPKQKQALISQAQPTLKMMFPDITVEQVNKLPTDFLQKIAQAGGEEQYKKEQDISALGRFMKIPETNIPGIPPAEVGGGGLLPKTQLFKGLADINIPARPLTRQELEVEQAKKQQYTPEQWGEITARKEGVIPTTEELTDDIKEYKYALKQGYKGTLQEFILSGKRAGAASQVVNVGDKTRDVEMEKLHVKRYEKGLEASEIARTKMDTYTVAMELIKNAEQGRFIGAALGVARIGKAMGLEVDPKWNDTQALQMLSNKLAMEARSTSQGAGLAGNTSDKDLAFLKQSVIGITNPQEVNRISVEIEFGKAKRDYDLSNLATKYFEVHDTWKGWEDTKNKWIDSHSIIDDIPSLKNREKQSINTNKIEMIHPKTKEKIWVTK